MIDRERAREIVEDQVSMTGYVGSKSWLIDRIAAALAAVREEVHDAMHSDCLNQARAEGREQERQRRITADEKFNGELVRQARAEGERMMLERAAGAVPTNWCDELLSGPKVGRVPMGCPDVERLLIGIVKRIRALQRKP